MQLIAMLREIAQIYPDSGFSVPRYSLAHCAKNRGALIEIYTGEQEINSNVDNEVGKNNLNPSSAQLIEEKKGGSAKLRGLGQKD